MQLILRPVSDTQLKEIIVTDHRFAIGRNEAPFNTYDRSIVAKLSRRHARIFDRDGLIYVADLHSSNGTTVNGDPVEGEPVQLRLNDELQFGGLRFRVGHIGETGDTADKAPPDIDVKVVLKPKSTDGSIKPIVISRFPFLVSRYSDVFARYQETIPQHLSFISKKHAHFFVDNERVYIEDLGSTNGTYVSGEELSEHARQLADGDTIAFGGERFLYEAQVFIGKEKVAGAEPKIEKLADGTIFVDDATNFFEIYMGAGDEDEDEPAEEAVPEGTLARMREQNSRLGRGLRFFDQLSGSLKGGQPFDKRLRWGLAASIVCVLLGIAGYVYLAWPVQQVTELLDNGEYHDAAELANDYLASRPDDERLQDLSTEATLKALVPEWLEAITDERYDEAQQTLARAREIGSNNPQAGELIAVLELATTLSVIESGSGGDQLSVDMFALDPASGVVVDEWEAQQTENARALSRVELQVDGFNVFRAEFFRRLRSLRKRERDLEPIITTRAAIVDSLARRDTVALRKTVREFSENYPTVEGLPMLQEDLRRYEAVEQDIAEFRWLRAHEQMNVARFNTAPFENHVTYMNENVLPDTATRDAYSRALDAWIAGDSATAFSLLEDLSDQRWGEVARQELARNRALLNSLADLQANRDATGFEDRLFGLYGKLDPERDVYLRQALQPDFQRHSQAALDRAAELTRMAEKAWKDYDTAGRLRTVHRLEEQVSVQYRNLAGLLTAAHQHLRESEGIYQQLGTPIPERWVLLNRDVVQEIKLQTGALADLLVIEPEIQKAKLSLLPALSG